MHPAQGKLYLNIQKIKGKFFDRGYGFAIGVPHVVDRPDIDFAIALNCYGRRYCRKHFSSGDTNPGNVTFVYTQDYHCCIGASDIWPLDAQVIGQLLLLRYIQYT